MKIIAKRIDEEVYLIDIEKDMTGFIADFDREARYSDGNVYSILARGYWGKSVHDEELMKKVLLLPVVEPVKTKIIPINKRKKK